MATHTHSTSSVSHTAASAETALRKSVEEPFPAPDLEPVPADSEAKITLTTSRRHILAALSGAAFAGGALVLAMPTEAPATVKTSATVGDDTVLLTLCAQFEVLQKTANDLWSWRINGVNVRGPDFIEDDDEREAALKPIDAALDPLVDKICALVPTTFAGFRAVARCLLLWDGDRLDATEVEDDQNRCVNDRLLVGLLRGLVAGEDLRPVWCREARV